MAADPTMNIANARYEIVNVLGLHARAATKLVQLASRFPCDVTVSREGQNANAKSVMGVLLLCASKGSFITVDAKGEQADECVKALGELIASRFGEPE
jgi:phosphocarrier protein HPr